MFACARLAAFVRAEVACVALARVLLRADEAARRVPVLLPAAALPADLARVFARRGEVVLAVGISRESPLLPRQYEETGVCLFSCSIPNLARTPVCNPFLGVCYNGILTPSVKPHEHWRSLEPRL